MEELQQKVNSISQELAMFQLRELERNNLLEKRIKELETLTGKSLLFDEQQEKRIKILEDIRLVQRQLNQKFENAIIHIEKNQKESIKIPIKIEEEKSKSFWDIFR